MNWLQETEHALLALMLDSDCRARARSLVKPKWLADPANQRLLEAAFAWDTDNETELTIHGWAKLYAQRSEIPVNDAGAQIAGVVYHSTASKNLQAYADLIREDWERREIGKIGAGVYHAAKNGDSPLDLAAQASSATEIVRERHSESLTGEQALAEAAMRSRGGQIDSGFVGLDRMLCGMSPGDLVTVAARTSMGKSAFAVDIMRYLCEQSVPVGYVTLEMDPAEVYSRMIRYKTPIHSQPRFWFPKRRATVEAIAAQGLNWAADRLGCLIVDHLGLIASEGKSRSFYERTTDNVHDMKRLARTLEIPVVMLAQLNREAADGRMPELADLRDSGAIEEDSDAVILLHRPAYYDRTKDRSEAWATLAKNRHGRTGSVRLHWDEDLASFRNWTEGGLIL